MIIRPLEPGDVELVVRLGKLMHRESGYRDLDYSPDKVRELCFTIIDNPSSYFGLVAHNDTHIAGMLGGVITPHFFGNDLTAHDILVYLHPNFRGSTTVVRMIRAYEAWAIKNGASYISLGVSAEINADRVGKLYERLGYSYVGPMYKKKKVITHGLSRSQASPRTKAPQGA